VKQRIRVVPVVAVMYGVQLLARFLGCAVSVDSAAAVERGYAHGQGRIQRQQLLAVVCTCQQCFGCSFILFMHGGGTQLLIAASAVAKHADS
jgi:hypothetical protein